ncbi:hypothetical protein SB717_35445, partial [Priestia sp. SIMBA_032]
VWITLISSLAPSVTWLSLNFLLNHFGWRNTCFIYAFILFIVILPIHRYVFKDNDSEREIENLDVNVVIPSNEVFRSRL